ncbi:SAF domain-containing protein [Nocardiopsis nanhaiensis]
MVDTQTRARGEPETTPLRLPHTRRRWRSLVLMGALMVAGATAAMLALAQVDQREPVLVAAADLPAGHQVTAADVRVVDLAGADTLSTVSDPAQAVGSVLTMPVAEGALLGEGLLGGEGEHLAEGQVEVSAAVEPGRVPASVGPGAQVAVVITGEEAGEVSYPAQVGVLDQTSNGDTRVDLVIDSSHASDVARAAAEGEIALVHTPGDGS